MGLNIRIQTITNKLKKQQENVKNISRWIKNSNISNEIVLTKKTSRKRKSTKNSRNSIHGSLVMHSRKNTLTKIKAYTELQS
jgi:hypothetical protein